MPSSGELGDWQIELLEGENDPHVDFVDVFLGLLKDNFEALEGIGISRDDIAIWVLYEYDGECNLTFHAADLMRLGEAGIDLCVSCWQSPAVSE